MYFSVRKRMWYDRSQRGSPRRVENNWIIRNVCIWYSQVEQLVRYSFVGVGWSRYKIVSITLLNIKDTRFLETYSGNDYIKIKNLLLLLRNHICHIYIYIAVRTYVVQYFQSVCIISRNASSTGGDWYSRADGCVHGQCGRHTTVRWEKCFTGMGVAVVERTGLKFEIKTDMAERWFPRAVWFSSLSGCVTYSSRQTAHLEQERREHLCVSVIRWFGQIRTVQYRFAKKNCNYTFIQ